MKLAPFLFLAILGLFSAGLSSAADLTYTTIDKKSSVKMSVDTKALTGTPPFTYQWRKAAVNSFNFLDIPGAVSDSYSIPIISQTDAGTYQALVKNSAGGTTTNNVILLVTVPVTPPVTTPPGNANASAVVTVLP